MKSDPARTGGSAPGSLTVISACLAGVSCCALIAVLLPAIAAALAASCRNLRRPTELCSELFCSGLLILFILFITQSFRAAPLILLSNDIASKQGQFVKRSAAPSQRGT